MYKIGFVWSNFLFAISLARLGDVWVGFKGNGKWSGFVSPFGMNSLKLLKGSIEGALGAHLVAKEPVVFAFGECAADGGLDGERIGRPFDISVGLLGVNAFIIAVVDELLLIARSAGEPPSALDNTVGKELLDVALGGELGKKVGAECREKRHVLIEKENIGGQEAVLDGVHGGANLAFEGARARAFESVEAVGVDLFLSGHSCLPNANLRRGG